MAQLEDATITGSKILMEGYLYKKGKLNKNWKKRYFILFRDRKLKYFSMKPSMTTKEIGFINLYLLTGISTHQCDNTDQVYDLNNPNIKKNSRYYEEQDIFQSLSPKHSKNKNKKNKIKNKNSSLLIEYIYKLYTPKRIWYLRCKNEKIMNEWTTKIKEITYGNILYESHLLIQETTKLTNNKQWKTRWCVLTDKYHLRIYEDETQSKYKDCLKMEQLNMICYNDKETFRYYNNRREYPMNLSRTDKTFKIATLSHKSRCVWMDKFAQLMNEEIHKMEILREGYVWIFEQYQSGLKHWDKKYCGIDNNNYIYFSDDFDQFRCFTKGIYFDLTIFEEEKQKELDGYLPLFDENKLFKCGQVYDDEILEMFKGTQQENNSNIFYVQFANNINIYNEKSEKETEYEEKQYYIDDKIMYFATTSEIELKSWLHHFKLLQKEYCKQNNIPIVSTKHSINNHHLTINNLPIQQKQQQYESKMNVGQQLIVIDDAEENDDIGHTLSHSVIETMPFYSTSRISISITQSCLDMNTENNIDLSTIKGTNKYMAQKESAWSSTWQEMNNFSILNGKIMDSQSSTTCQSIITCPCFQRISFIMQFYDDWCAIKRKLDIIKASMLSSQRSPISPITPSIDNSMGSPTPHSTTGTDFKLCHIPSDDNDNNDDNDDDDDNEEDGDHDDDKKQEIDTTNYGIYDYLNHHFKEYSTMRLINDYYHIFLYHKYNLDDFDFIYCHLPTTININNSNKNKKGYGNKCNVVQCDIIKRNERQRGADNVKKRHRLMSINIKESYFGYKDIKQITCIQLLDRIHSVLYHSYDLFRLSPAEKKLIHNNNEDDVYLSSKHKNKQLNISGSDDSNYELFRYSMSIDDTQNETMYIDHNFAAIHKIMRSKQTKLIQIRNQLNRNNNKFLTELQNDDDNKSNMLLFDNFTLNDITEMSPEIVDNENNGFPDIDKVKSMSSSHTRSNSNFNNNNNHSSNHSRLPTLDTNIGSINIGSLSHQQNMNAFGIKFTYWKEEKYENNNNNDDKMIYITPKYANLKQEILSNKLCNISRMDWDQTFFSAQNMLQSYECKEFIADLTESEVKKYKIKDGSGIIINHLQSLMLYCNYGDTLHKHLTYTYYDYDINGYDDSFEIFQDSEIIKRHSEYGNWAKYLTEFVTIFGKNIYKSSEFYHGITCKYKFSDLRIYYNYPISVTTKLNIATHFVNKQGIILKLNRSEMMSGPKIINCSWFSDKEYEEEVLLKFVNKRPLKITSIIELNTSYSYYYHLCAINILDDIINGREINKSNMNNTLKLQRLHELLQYKFNVETYEIYEIETNQSNNSLHNMYNNNNNTEIISSTWLTPVPSSPQRASPRYSTFVHKMDYIHKLFIAYCNHQNNLIKFDIKLITTNKSLNENIGSYFISTESKNINCLKMDALIKLFPSAKAFEIKCPVLHSFTFDCILKLLDDKLIQQMNSQIHQITFKWVNWVQQQHCNIDDILLKYHNKFENYSWSINKKHKYGFDFIMIEKNE